MTPDKLSEDKNIPLTVEIVDLVIDMLSADASRARMESEILKLLNRYNRRDNTLATVLQEFVSKHEAGLLPDRFVYDKAIKIFKDGL